MKIRYFIQNNPLIIYSYDCKIVKEFLKIDTVEDIKDYIELNIDRKIEFLVNDKELLKFLRENFSNRSHLGKFENLFNSGEYKNYSSLPLGYIFKFGKYIGRKVDKVPESYILWFEKNISNNRW